MTDDSHLMFEIAGLALHSLNGTLDEIGLQRLEALLESNPLAVEYYQEILWTFVGIKSMKGISCLQEVSNSVLGREFWQVMQQQEKVAPPVEITETEEATSQELIRKVNYPPKEKRKLSKFSIFMLFNTAAVFLFFIYLRFAPPPGGVEVVTLIDSINAKWADLDMPMHKGTRLSTGNERLLLREGCAELLFDTNARVIIEGPAQFQILADDRIELDYGNIYSSVPKDAIGFSVYTENAKVIDLGTEFAIEADFNGNTQLHVIDGKTVLIVHGQSDKKGITVSQGEAKKIAADSSEISDIPCDYDHFVRSIDSQAGMVWRGENLSLAGIAAGGDGIQELGSLASLDPVKAEYVESTADVYVRTNNTYNLTPDIKWLDGVFVPDGEYGPVQITSSGLTFDCPDTSGIFTHEIIAYKGSIANQHETTPPVIIDGQEIVREPILMLHSNIGVTFDLQAIRDAMPQVDIRSLKAMGIPTTESTFSEFKFWVLVDGRIKYEREITGYVNRGPVSFDIEFGPQDRFLTLVVTDTLGAMDEKNSEKGSNVPAYASDFFYLINPELCLTGNSERSSSESERRIKRMP